MKNIILSFVEFCRCIKDNTELEIWVHTEWKTSTVNINSNLNYYFNTYKFRIKDKNKSKDIIKIMEEII